MGGEDGLDGGEEVEGRDCPGLLSGHPYGISFLARCARSHLLHGVARHFHFVQFEYRFVDF